MNMMMLLEMAAEGFGERIAFVNGDDALTCRELFDLSLIHISEPTRPY